jgi:hypothetical protein
VDIGVDQLKRWPLRRCLRVEFNPPKLFATMGMSQPRNARIPLIEKLQAFGIP